MTSLVLYIFGALLVVAGVSYGAHLAGVPFEWLAVLVIVLLGLALMGAARRAKAGSEG